MSKIILSYVVKDEFADRGFSVAGYAGEASSIGDAYELITEDKNIKKKKSVFLVGFRDEEFGVIDIFGKYTKDGLVVVHDEGVHCKGSESDYRVFGLSEGQALSLEDFVERREVLDKLRCSQSIANTCHTDARLPMHIAISSYEIASPYLIKFARDKASVRILKATEELALGNITPTQLNSEIDIAVGRTNLTQYQAMRIYQLSLKKEEAELFLAVENICIALRGSGSGGISALKLVMQDARKRLSDKEFKELSESKILDRYITMPDLFFTCIMHK